MSALDCSAPSSARSNSDPQNGWARQAPFSPFREEETETQSRAAWPEATKQTRQSGLGAEDRLTPGLCSRFSLRPRGLGSPGPEAGGLT